jgi:hypothetical protein
VLATVGSTSKSELEFWDLDFNVDDTVKRDASKEEWAAGIQQLGVADHYGVTDVEWDPSGRYLATAASAWTHTVRYQPIEYFFVTCLRSHRTADRERVRDLGFQGPGDREAASGPIQAVPVAPTNAVVADERTEADDTEEPARVLTRV